METLAATAAAAFVSAVIGAAVGAFVSLISAGKRKHDDGEQARRERADAQQEVLKLLAVDKITYLTQQAVNNGEITIKQRTYIHELAKAARALGANGETKECDRIVDEIPVKH